ncbi:GNAT family N-acetyltransferase [Stutzerimonas tarimensis]|uniref:GNAT family N-acetyltransferase n=1 Tax=Stutzerimonas tarimensis TaxID=1507735 RepID=A0ABV7T1M5_9GAMM
MMSEFTIRHDRQKYHFEVNLDGRCAYLAYMDLGKQTLDFYRTYVPEDLRGHGIAAAIVQEALDFANREGYVVIPSCSYVESYLERDRLKASQAG